MKKCLLLLFALSLVVAASPAFSANVDLCANSGFEVGTGTGNGSAPPWSFWGGTGGAIANPFPVPGVDTTPRVWSNFGNPTYVNVAAQNNMSKVWLINGETYHYHALYYVPASEIAAGMKAVPAIRLSMMTAGAPFVVDDSLAAALVPDSWNVIDGDWVYVSPTSTTDQMNYMGFRLYGRAIDPPNARFPNPGGYFDNCEFSGPDTEYAAPNLTGYVKNSATLAGISGVVVTVKDALGAVVTTAITDGFGQYTVPCPRVVTIGISDVDTWSVEAGAFGFYTADGPQSFTYNATPVIPDLTMTLQPTCVISGTVSDPGGPVVGATVSFKAGTSGLVLTTTTNGVGFYSKEVILDLAGYTVTASQFPLSASALVSVYDSDGYPLAAVTQDFLMTDSTLVSLAASGLAPGAITTWTNTGSLGGQFELLGTSPVAGPHGIYDAVYFDNNPMVLKDALGAVITAPAAITGAANYTVSAWLFEPNPTLPDQQTYVSWAKRGGPDGSNCEMVYGTNGTWGAAGHWGGPDMPWGTPPTAGIWHNVVVTYDGIAGVETDYIDGVFSATETGKALAIGADLPIVLGAGYWYDAPPTIAPDVVYSGYIAQLDIYGIAASAADAESLAGMAPPALAIGVINGKVTTTDSSEPSGFTVTAIDSGGVLQAAVVTGADGAYSFTLGAPGTYTVSAIKSSYVTVPAPQTTALGIGATVTLADFVASPSGISGIVKDFATGDPIRNAVVQTGGRGDTLVSAMVTDETGRYSLPGTGCGGIDLYADAVNYTGRLMLVANTGNVRYDILLTSAVEPFSYDGDMEDLAPAFKPAQWKYVDWSNAVDCIDWLASPDASNGLLSLFYCYNDTNRTEYAGIDKFIDLAPGYDYNFWFTAKADPEVKRWQPMVEFQDAGAGNWDGFVSHDPLYWEYSHMPPYDWHRYFNWMDRSGTWGTNPAGGVPVRWRPTPLQTVCHWIFLYEGDDANGPDRLPPAGKGCYIDDLVLDAVPQDLAYTEETGTVSPFGIAGKVMNADGDGIPNAVVQVGAGPAVITDADGNYLITGIIPAVGVAFYADALGYADDSETIDTTDALSAWLGVMTKDVTLTDKDETDYSYVQNGGFENVVAGKPVGWGVGLADATHSPSSGDQSYLTADATNPACGTYSAKFLPIIQNYEGVVQFIPVVAGSTYNLYWRLKSDTGVRGAWTWIYWTDDAGAELVDLYNNWNWWAAPTAWTQYPGSIAACGDNWTGAYAPIVGAIPPEGATRMYLYFGCESPDPPGGDIWPWDGGSLDIDCVVVDRIGPAAPSLRQLVGVNNRSVLTDDKLVGPLFKVKVWGKVMAVVSATQFEISDGYSGNVIINGSSAGLGTTNTVVVVGVVNADKSIDAESIIVAVP